MNEWCRRIEEHRAFHQFVMAAIILNAAALGLETVPSIHNPDHPNAWLKALHWVFQGLFTVELLIRFGAAKSPVAFARDGWNVFDTVVVAIGMFPAIGESATIVRLARVLRIARLVEVSAEMKLIVGTIVNSMRALTKLILMIGVLLYSYAIIGYHLFRDEDKENWGSLGRAMWTLFQTMTLEGWTDKQQTTFKESPHETWVFYATFLILATYFVMNLFVAIVVNNLQELKEAEKKAGDAAHPQRELLAEIAALKEALGRIEDRVRDGT